MRLTQTQTQTRALTRTLNPNQVRRGSRGLPTLSYVSDEYDRFGVKCGDATLHTVGGFHGNFVDAPLWGRLAQGGSLAALLAHPVAWGVRLRAWAALRTPEAPLPLRSE